MRIATLLVLVASMTARAPLAQQGGADEIVPMPIPVATMGELMVDLIYPASDAILYVTSRTPTTEEEWNVLQGKALMMAESANLLMMPLRAVDDDQWMKDAQLMLDAGVAAYEAAKARDLDALAELNDPVYTSCVTCHEHYHPKYQEYRDQAASQENE
jgi:cytochrome c553